MIGVLAFIITLFFLVLVHEWGHFITARKFGVKVEEFGFGFPPRIGKKKWRGTNYTLNWLPFGGFVRLKGEDTADKSSDSYAAQPAWKRSIIVLAGIGMNLLVAAILLSVVAFIGGKQDITNGVKGNAVVSEVSHIVVDVVPEGPSHSVLQPGDEINSIDGKEFQSLQELQNYLARQKDVLDLALIRANEEVSVEIMPRAFQVQGIEGDFYGLGTQLQSVGKVSYPWWQAPIEGVRMTLEVFVLIVSTLWNALVGLFTQQSSGGIDLAGPVGIAVLTGDIVKLGFVTFIQFVAILSINLAFLNLLPIPALDGGRFAFLLFEIITRRAVPEKLEIKLHRIGFSLLLLLVIIVTMMDIGRFGGGLTNLIQGIF